MVQNMGKQITGNLYLFLSWPGFAYLSKMSQQFAFAPDSPVSKTFIEPVPHFGSRRLSKGNT
jgi:hypothetical protein